ncbi:hypothetical protein ACQP1W_28060 [Spirillospora sp. CA-255316]
MRQVRGIYRELERHDLTAHQLREAWKPVEVAISVALDASNDQSGQAVGQAALDDHWQIEALHHRHLPRRPFPDPHRHRPRRHGRRPQPRHRDLKTLRLDQHCRHQPAPPPRRHPHLAALNLNP